MDTKLAYDCVRYKTDQLRLRPNSNQGQVRPAVHVEKKKECILHIVQAIPSKTSGKNPQLTRGGGRNETRGGDGDRTITTKDDGKIQQETEKQVRRRKSQNVPDPWEHEFAALVNCQV